jgi:hypothetical protein
MQPRRTCLNTFDTKTARLHMARKKSPEDLEWEQIFNAIEFESEPDPRYIKTATITTKSGKKFKLNGHEFSNVMEHERNLDPEEAVIASCKVTLDFQKIKNDVTSFAIKSLDRSARRYPKSRSQQSQKRSISRASRKQAPSSS